MDDTHIPPRELTRLVRSALTHIYDYASLENHPLAAVVDASGGLDRVTRAQRLRRLLLDCIEEIKPQESGLAAEADRVHAILTYRYVDGLPMDQVAAKRGLGERQAYRALQKGIRAVAGLLYDQVHEQGRALEQILPADSEAPGDPASLAQAEVARLRQAGRAEPLQLEGVLQGVVGLLVPHGEKTGTRLRVWADGPFAPVIAHRVMLRQALLSLLTHALDHVVRSELLIAVCSGAGVVRVDIRGPAAGSQASAAASRQAEAGLAVARTLLQAQGGRLETGSEAGEWWARVTLPTAGRATILVVDDNADLVALVRRYLAGHQVDVLGATGAEQALNLAAEVAPDLITLDVMMPDQDGWEVLQRLKGSPETAGIPVIICSVLQEAPLAETMGASGYITKPVGQAELIQEIARWLGPLRPIPGS